MPEPTIASRIAERCAVDDFNGANGQMCVVSSGFDLEGIASHLLRCALLGVRAMNACVSFVLLPDNTKSGTLARVASALTLSFHTHSPNPTCTEPVRVHLAEEGASPKTRCAFYQSGGVVVLSCRTMCADILRRRVAHALVGAVVVLLPHGCCDASGDATVAGIAFCAEIFLRGDGLRVAGRMPAEAGEEDTVLSSADTQCTGTRRRPPFVVLTDDACLARYFVQRRRTGQESFLSQAHIDDMQLFPRFRLNIMQHFERVAAEWPMTVERIEISPAPAVEAMHSLLCRILREVAAELRAMDARLASCNNTAEVFESESHESHGTGIQPGRPRLEEGGRGRGDRRLCAVGMPRYARRPWLRGGDETELHFTGITDADAVDVTDRSMDEDLHTALRAHTSTAWPFTRLVESLLDVRGLLRALRRLSPFAFLFALDASLAQRMPRRVTRALGRSRNNNGNVAAPDAPWTLSSHFAAVVALAVHRIGEVREVSAESALVDVDAEEPGARGEGMDDMLKDSEANKNSKEVEEEDDVVCVGPARILAPRRDEVDPTMEYAVRITNAWGRDVTRRSNARKRKTEEEEAVVVDEEKEKAEGEVVHWCNERNSQVFLLVVFGERALHRYVCRLTHTLEEFQQLELNGFIAAYQSRYGGDMLRRAEAPTTEPPHVAQLRSWFRTASDVPLDVDESLVAPPESLVAPPEGLVAPPESLVAPPEGLVAPPESLVAPPESLVASPEGLSGAVGASLRGVLLSQSPVAPAVAPAVAAWGLESVGDGFARLRLSREAQALVVDGTLLRAAGLAALLAGTHAVLSRSAPPRRVLVAGECLRFLRLLEAAQDALRLCARRPLPRLQLLGSPAHAVRRAEAETGAEREAFEGLAHAKANMTATLLAHHGDMRETRERMDTVVAQDPRRNAHARRRDPPLVVFDEREFRSLLPYALYCRGVELVPLTLATADYVISPDHALERKSVPDFVQSLVSGRIHTQLAALSRRFTHPMCLIEFDRTAPFRICTSSPSVGSAPFFTRVARLFAAYPRVRLLWSRDPFHSASMLHEMKRTYAQAPVDPSAPSLTRTATAAADADDAAGEKEAAHMAARVLSCFPGITPENAPAVMAVCGSLAGLGTIEENSLAQVMGAEAAKKLYTFLHGDLIEPVEQVSV